MKLVILLATIGLSAAGLLPNYLPPNQGYSGYQEPSYNARPRSGLERSAAILRSDAEVNDLGYHFAYETENGIQAQESGQEADGIQAQGGYSYTGDDGQVYSVQYTAGAGGFQVQGAHIPTPPPLPEAIARALQENARDEANGIFDDGSYHDGKYAADASSSSVVAARTSPSRQYLTPQADFRNSGYRY